MTANFLDVINSSAASNTENLGEDTFEIKKILIMSDPLSTKQI